MKEAAGSGVEVSIVVPAHDDAVFLRTCLESVAQQGFEAWECLVIDDCSVDVSRSVAAEFAEADGRFRVIRHDRNLGLAATRNTGLARAQGHYVTFLDADDFLFQDSLAIRHAAAEDAKDPAVVGSWCDWVAVPEMAGLGFLAPPGEKTGTVDYRSAGGRNQFISSSPLLRLDVVRSLGGFDDTFRTAEDFEFWTRLLRNGFRLVGTGVTAVAYRQKRVSMISADPLGHARNAAAVHQYMLRPLGDGVSSLAVDPHLDPLVGVPGAGALEERLVTFLTYAALTGNQAQVDGVRAMIDPNELHGLDVDDLASRAVARHALRVGGLSVEQREKIVATVRAEVSTLTRPSGDRGRGPSTGSLRLERVERVAQHERAGLPPARIREARPLPALAAWDVVLSASSSEGAIDLLILGRELVDAGHSVAFVSGGDRAVDRLALVEGIRIVAPPMKNPNLLISSGGQAPTIDSAHSMVVCTEPWVRKAHGRPDLVLARDGWERDLWAATGAAVELGGWLSRASRMEPRATPRDGEVNRGRLPIVLVVRGPGDRTEIDSARVEEAVGDTIDLLFGEHMGAKPGVTISADRIPVLAPMMAAVVVVGASLPIDALITGTPVLTLEAPPVGHAAVRAVTLQGLADAIDESSPGSPASSSEDWLNTQVAAAKRFLD